jgi:hypothetical protein
MKLPALILLSALSLPCAHAARLIPSALDPSLSEARESAYIPWSDPGQSTAYWEKLSKKNVPIYNERKEGNLSRDIYTPNPGIGYWVLGGLTEKSLFKTHKEKLKIDDTLISASVFKDERGNNVYWALWAPKNRADLLTDRMKELGISQARIEYSIFDKLEMWGASLAPYTGAFSLVLIGMNVLLMAAVVALLFKLAQPGKNT